jgi:hypothetical protein
MKQSEVRRLRPELFSENIFYADECLNHQGALSGLQLAVNADWVCYSYASEKVASVKRVVDGIQHNLDIIASMEARDLDEWEIKYLEDHPEEPCPPPDYKDTDESMFDKEPCAQDFVSDEPEEVQTNDPEEGFK